MKANIKLYLSGPRLSLPGNVGNGKRRRWDSGKKGPDYNYPIQRALYFLIYLIIEITLVEVEIWLCEKL